jgi:hypothetical protein
MTTGRSETDASAEAEEAELAERELLQHATDKELVSEEAPEDDKAETQLAASDPRRQPELAEEEERPHEGEGVGVETAATAAVADPEVQHE